MCAICPGEAKVAEDDVLDTAVEEVAAVRDASSRVLADQPSITERSSTPSDQSAFSFVRTIPRFCRLV